MEISKKIANILRGVYSEYGLNETIRRINLILNQKISVEGKATVDFSPNSITINCKKPINILFEDDDFIVSQEYKGYKTYNYFDLDTNLFRKAVSFQIDDGSYLVLDQIDIEEFNSTRLLKTKKDDGKFLDSYFERETMLIKQYPIDEISTYKEYANKDTDEFKTIMSDERDLYYYHHSLDYKLDRFLEAAVCFSKPRYYVLGRTRRESELLKEALRAGCPNIQMRGNYPNSINSLNYYDVIITKDPNKRIICIEVSDYSPSDNKNDKKRIAIPIGNNYNYFSIKDLFRIIIFFSKKDYPFGRHIIEELMKITETYKEHLEGPKEIDSISINMATNYDFNHFAFNIYENLAEYNALLEGQIKKPQGPKKQ